MHVYIKDTPLLHHRRTGPYHAPGANAAFKQDKLLPQKPIEHRDETQDNSPHHESSLFWE